MAATRVDDDEHVVRFVKPKDLRRDEDGNVIGVNATAFQLREGEGYLSASCLEVADPEKMAALKVLKGIYTKQFSKVQKYVFSVGRAGDVRTVCARKSSVRILKENSKWNPAYAVVRQFPDDDWEIKEQLASQYWADWHHLSKL